MKTKIVGGTMVDAERYSGEVKLFSKILEECDEEIVEELTIFNEIVDKNPVSGLIYLRLNDLNKSLINKLDYSDVEEMSEHFFCWVTDELYSFGEDLNFFEKYYPLNRSWWMVFSDEDEMEVNENEENEITPKINKKILLENWEEVKNIFNTQLGE